MGRKAWLVALLILGSTTVRAATVNVPADHTGIQEALRAASPGDTVLVAPGEYREYVFVPAGISLIAAQGPDSTRIVSLGLATRLSDEHLVEFEEGADRSTLVQGFTLDPAGKAGTAIYCEKASPTIRGNVTADGFGFGLEVRRGSPLIDGNLVTGTLTFGALVFASSPEIVRNTFRDCNPRALEISGAKSHPVIGGGDPSNANRFFGNELDIVNTSVNDIDARGNDWGWETTALMGARPYPTDLPGIMDGNDESETRRGRGKVDYRDWITADESGESDVAGNRWLLPLLAGLGLILVIAVVVRR